MLPNTQIRAARGVKDVVERRAVVEQGPAGYVPIRRRIGQVLWNHKACFADAVRH